MAYRGLVATITLAAGLCMMTAGAQAWDESQYPNWKGRWQRPDGVRPAWVQPGDKAPLTAEYQKVMDDNVQDQKNGGMGTLPGGTQVDAIIRDPSKDFPTGPRAR